MFDKHMTMFTPGREPTDFTEHAIITGSHPSTYVPQHTLLAVTLYLKKFANTLQEARETSEMTHDEQKTRKTKTADLRKVLLLVTRWF